jgi:hypothetical protein
MWEWFFPKTKNYDTFIAKKIQRTHFLNVISSKTFKFINGFNLIDVYQYHSPFLKITQKFHQKP